MVNTELLINFKDLKISKNDLQSEMGIDLISLSVEKPVLINSTDVINMLVSYKSKNLTTEDMLNWVNVVWFTELFSYNDKECDSIASVMNLLEELDEKDITLSEDDIDKLIYVLKNNQEA